MTYRAPFIDGRLKAEPPVPPAAERHYEPVDYDSTLHHSPHYTPFCQHRDPASGVQCRQPVGHRADGTLGAWHTDGQEAWVDLSFDPQAADDERRRALAPAPGAAAVRRAKQLIASGVDLDSHPMADEDPGVPVAIELALSPRATMKSEG